MALVNVSPCPFFGHPHAQGGTVFSQSDLALNSSFSKLAYLVQAPKTGDTERLSIYIYAVTTAQNVVMRVEGLDSNGEPDGILIHADAESGAVSPITGWNHFDFTMPFAVTKGRWYAVVLEWASTAGDLDWHLNKQGSNNGSGHAMRWNGSSWGAGDNNAYMTLGWRMDDGTYGDGLGTILPLGPWSTYNIGNAEAKKEIGFRFRLPIKCRVAGIGGGLDFNNNPAKPKVIWYTDAQAPGAGTEVLQIGDEGGGESAVEQSAFGCRHFYQFKTPQVIEAER